MRFKPWDFELGRYEFRVMTADNLTGYCHWSSNFTNLTVVYTPSIFSDINYLHLWFADYLLSFLHKKKICLWDYCAVFVCVCVWFKLKLWPIFMKLYVNVVAFEDVMLLICHREYERHCGRANLWGGRYNTYT